MTWDGRHDYSVSELGAEIDAFLGEAFRDVWVVGSVERLRQHSNGHRYFELVEKGPGDRLVGRLDAVIWGGDRWRIENDLRRSRVDFHEGIEARCRVQVGYWGPGGRLQATVREIDPLFSLGALERRRRLVRERLVELGIAGANKRQSLSALPLTVGLLASADSAAYQDVLASLRASGYPFKVAFYDARVQGAAAEAELVKGLQRLGRQPGLACVAIVRGGGARGDLAAFDSLAVARAVAGCPVPVLTGLGHETDSTISDEVAWRACHTPTRVAEVLVGAVAAAAAAIEDSSRRLARAGQRGVQSGRTRLGRARSRLSPALRRLDRSESILARQIDRLSRATRAVAARAELRLEAQIVALGRLPGAQLGASERELSRRRAALATAAGRLLATAGTRLTAAARLTRELGPERWLERGFCITRDESGRVMREAAGTEVGGRLTTQLARGQLVSRVEEVRE